MLGAEHGRVGQDRRELALIIGELRIVGRQSLGLAEGPRKVRLRGIVLAPVATQHAEIVGRRGQGRAVFQHVGMPLDQRTPQVDGFAVRFLRVGSTLVGAARSPDNVSVCASVF